MFNKSDIKPPPPMLPVSLSDAHKKKMRKFYVDKPSPDVQNSILFNNNGKLE